MATAEDEISEEAPSAEEVSSVKTLSQLPRNIRQEQISVMARKVAEQFINLNNNLSDRLICRTLRYLCN